MKPWLARTMIAAALVCCGAGAQWWLTRPDTAPETSAPAQTQADGSVILERRPDPAPRPKQSLPRGAKLERTVSVTVQPDAPAPQAGAPCPPVTVDLSLINDGDGGRRVLANSPDGWIVGGLDIPAAPTILPAPAKRWAAGVSWSPANGTYGGWIDRDATLLGITVRTGLEIHQVGGSGIDARVRLGFAF